MTASCKPFRQWQLVVLSCFLCLSACSSPHKPIPSDAAFEAAHPQQCSLSVLQFLAVPFAYGSTELDERAEAAIEFQAMELDRTWSLRTTVLGVATDYPPSPKSEALAIARAEKVRREILLYGIDPDRVHMTTDPSVLKDSMFSDFSQPEYEAKLFPGVFFIMKDEMHD